MQRKDFLKGLGLFGIGATIPKAALSKVANLVDEPSNDEVLASCENMPSETSGPYPLPSSVSISPLVRSNITESTQTGVALTLTLTIVNTANSCAPLSGIRVDIWHCNKRGYYSAYAGQPGIDGTLSTVGETWLRGIQYTDSSGQVTFTTIYPGWYTSRATHIHVEVFNGSTLIATSQLAFPDALNTTLNTYYATSGTNSITNTTDSVFSDSYASELVTITGSTSAGYVAIKQIGVSVTTTSIENVETADNGQFKLGQNFPNPYFDETTIPFTLAYKSDVKIEFYDLIGRKITEIAKGNMNTGNQSVAVNTKAIGLISGNYVYQILITNKNGTFRQSKMMNAQK
jgi:protocatechuate 3,4-dioxygenase beta subunit